MVYTIPDHTIPYTIYVYTIPYDTIPYHIVLYSTMQLRMAKKLSWDGMSDLVSGKRELGPDFGVGRIHLGADALGIACRMLAVAREQS